ncbi:MAG: 16S rRNA (guanine(966)-N(2))-methyltransferase RsmD [Oscillospiraceae bacterium]|nr:16S rRNA (guanine(966)-N(2))-methyltransferase RsmD [Oscillospiraceae bacterium]
MRVITGSARGTNLKAPDGLATRPTADRVKQALFNIIQYEIAGSVLDLFAGSGQLGIEALSRGAAHAVFIDERTDAIRVIRENLRRTHLEEKAEVICSDYLSYLSRCRKRFRLIFLDPPYAEKSLENAIKRISEIDILAEGGIIIAERPLGKPLNDKFPGLVRSKDYNYGKTTITLFRRAEDTV